MNHNEKIVLVGGGGGVYQIARHLKRIRPNITTIQTMFDNGGHSGKLRDERGTLPPGDIRQAIVALADDSKSSVIRELLSARFAELGNKSSLDGVSLGNLMLQALAEKHGMPEAIAILSDIAGVPKSMQILPVSLDNAHLVVTFDNKTTMTGETLIDRRDPNDKRKILFAELEPKAHIFIKAYDALVQADKIVFCPGDFWTSLIPNTRVQGFNQAMAETKAKLIMVVNIMTKKVETHCFTVATFVNTLCNHIGRHINVVLWNESKIPDDIALEYEKEGSFPVKLELMIQAEDVIRGDFVDVTGGIIRHHQRVVSAIAEL